MIFFVLTLFAMFVLASLFLGCGRGMKMLKSMGDERSAENKESTPEAPPLIWTPFSQS